MVLTAKETQMSEAKIFSAKTEDAAARTIDGFDNFVSRLGLNNENTLSAGAYVFNLMTRNRIQLEAAYRGSWIVGQVIDCVAEDMTRAGINITTNEAEEDIKDLQAAIKRLGIWNGLCDLEKWSRLYGGAIAVIQIEGQKLDTPLRIDTVGQGQFQGLVVYDRWQLNPDLNRIIQAGPNMGLPEYYNIVTTEAELQVAPSAIGQVRVHHSRIIRGIGIKLPYFQAVTEMMWGESILERLWDRLIAFDSVTMSTANLIERANNRTIGVEGYREILAAGGKAKEGLIAQFEAMREFQTNEGLTVMDKNDTFQTTNYTFSGLADVHIQFGQQLAGASNIPLVRLFGQSPAGLNSTGESDMRMYYDSINAKQEAKFRSGLMTLLHVMWRSTFGKAAPKDLEFTFVPLWQMSAIDKSTVARTNAESVLGAHDSGVISRATALKELRASSGDTGLFSNISDDDIKEAEEEMPPDAPLLDDPEADLDPEKDMEEPMEKLTGDERHAMMKFIDWMRGRVSDDIKRDKDGKFSSNGGGGGGSSESKEKNPMRHMDKTDEEFRAMSNKEYKAYAQKAISELESDLKDAPKGGVRMKIQKAIKHWKGELIGLD